MPKRAVLVTGGAGYIGSHACKALARAGHVPVTLDNLAHGHASAVRWGPLVQGDVRDRALVERAMREHRVDAVVHFAAFAYVGESMRDPGKYFGNNVAGTIAVLDAMRACDVRRIVFSSTCATYGMPRSLPIREDHPQDPISPYGESKRVAERALHWYGLAHGLSSVALRYFNAAGADLDGEIGEDHDPETHLVPLAIGAALGTHPPLQICGTDYPTPDGTAVRDYVHVSDLADAHARALDYLVAGGDSVALNLGTGRGYSVREVVAAVERVARRPVPRRDVARRAGDPPSLIADASRAHDLLGWAPRCSELQTIVDTAWRWHAS
jgi:UDP-arabinose 4-epimerase